MSVDREYLYDSAKPFFELRSSVTMKLTPNAAIEACIEAAAEDASVVRVEVVVGTRTSGLDAERVDVAPKSYWETPESHRRAHILSDLGDGVTESRG